MAVSLPPPEEGEWGADSPMETAGQVRRRHVSDTRDALANALMLPEWCVLCALNAFNAHTQLIIPLAPGSWTSRQTCPPPGW